jgi:hypothetical protein
LSVISWLGVSSSAIKFAEAALVVEPAAASYAEAAR